jgi:single-stranded-DNA-specific exonuclease
MDPAVWQLHPPTVIPEDFQQWLMELGEPYSSPYLAQLLWQRGIRDRATAQAFLDPDQYTPTPPWAFGAEMDSAIARLQQARDRQDTVYIWGDFDADGLTATAVLWEGLGEFFVQNETLFYTIPNRLTESHGLSKAGLDRLAHEGCNLIVTCDTGSHNLAELAYAQTLGIDVIVTDHHTLPPERPPVTAMINPRYFAPDHPLAHLSGVAVAYKLLEALYETLPNIPTRPLETYLDLVAIGLIADLVALKGDCRYLAQRGLKQLQQQLTTRSRPGVAKLLELCRRTGDRPTDIGFGLGPRINALSRIQGDARDGVILLTSSDVAQAEAIAEQAEWTNLYRKEVQRRTAQQVEARLNYLDLSSTAVIVLSDPQWSVGILGLVANQIAQTYGRPTLLLSEETVEGQVIAKGSARSLAGIDLYDLLQRQAHLLIRYGGHPFAAGLSLPLANLPLFTEAINHDLRQRLGQLPTVEARADLALTLAEIGDGVTLFKAFKALEPFGMGNPPPSLLLRDVWFERARTTTLRDRLNQKLSYHRTTFTLRDDSTLQGMSGIVWGKMAADLPQTRCDILAELDYNAQVKPNGYHLRLVAMRPREDSPPAWHKTESWILDWRSNVPDAELEEEDVVSVKDCPQAWEGLDPLAQRARNHQQKLALAYQGETVLSPSDRWQTLVGIAKFLARTGQSGSVDDICDRCQLTPTTLTLGLTAMASMGFEIKQAPPRIYVRLQSIQALPLAEADALRIFLETISEEIFQQQYFQKVSVGQLQQVLEQRL